MLRFPLLSLAFPSFVFSAMLNAILKAISDWGGVDGCALTLQVPLEPSHKVEPDTFSIETAQKAAAEQLMAAEHTLAELAGLAGLGAAAAVAVAVSEAEAVLKQAKKAVAAAKPPTLIIKKADVKGQLAKKKAAGDVGGALAGQAEEHKQKRKNIRERLEAKMSDAERATMTQQMAAETKTKSTRQRNRMKLKDFRQKSRDGGNAAAATTAAGGGGAGKEGMVSSVDMKVSMGTVFGWRSRDSARSSDSARSTDSQASSSSGGGGRASPRSVLSRSGDMARSRDGPVMLMSVKSKAGRQMLRSRDMTRSVDEDSHSIHTDRFRGSS